MRILLVTALALSLAPATYAHAQYAVPATVQRVSPADQLAAVMRRLAAEPTDLQALISAGELSVKLDDMSAAAAFFARADKIDPRNGRVKAGMASILVRAERPGEALRFYQLAERYGLDPSRFAADRGLAYDLVGEQERAQRDYRLALRTTRSDETVRRYALSLGVSGRREQALEQLEPMIRRQDRAAWRVRAFILAMTGDAAGANKIAAAMMPAGMASGMRPFFQQLPRLSAADRAFAVHFGEVRPTPARLADARMKPPLPPLGPDPNAPVQVAAADTSPPVAARRGGQAAGRGQGGRAQLAARAPARTSAATRRASRPVQTPRSSSRPVAPASRAATDAPARGGPSQPVRNAPVRVASVAPASPPRAYAPETPAPAPASVAAATTPSVVRPAPVVKPVAAAPAPSFADLETNAAAAASTPAVRSEDSILARIVSSITIPGEELGVTAPERQARTAAATDPATVWMLTGGQVQAARETADRAAAARTIARADKARPAAERRLAARKAAEKKAAAKKQRGDPERIWVQVAGGASESDLPRAWAAAQKKAAALKGREAYTTPLRATNRVVTGPFKTEAEAQAFVNRLARQGVSAFQFTSAAGQKMTKLKAE